MIEKYGTDPDTIAPADDQIRLIKKLSKETGEDFNKFGFSTAKEAEEVIKKLEKKAGAL